MYVSCFIVCSFLTPFSILTSDHFEEYETKMLTKRLGGPRVILVSAMAMSMFAKAWAAQRCVKRGTSFGGVSCFGCVVLTRILIYFNILCGFSWMIHRILMDLHGLYIC